MSTNTYDKRDIVRREAVIIADGNGALKMAAYRVRDPDTGEFSELQFHATFNNMVLSVMGQHSAKLFARFVTDTLAPARSFEGEDVYKAPTHPQS